MRLDGERQSDQEQGDIILALEDEEAAGAGSIEAGGMIRQEVEMRERRQRKEVIERPLRACGWVRNKKRRPLRGRLSKKLSDLSGARLQALMPRGMRRETGQASRRLWRHMVHIRHMTHIVANAETIMTFPSRKVDQALPAQ